MKTKIVLFLSMLICSALITKAQWDTHYFGDLLFVSPDLITNCQVVDPLDNSIINVGYYKDVSSGNTNAVITKISSSNAIVWQKEMPGNSIYYSVIVAANGDYVVAGTNGVLNWGGQGLICRYSNAGTLLYSQAVNDQSWYLLFTGLCELANGNITVVGYENNLNVNYPSIVNGFIETFDPALNPMWAKSLSNPTGWSPKTAFLSTICDAQTIYVVGYTDNVPHTGYDGTVAQFDYSGALNNVWGYGISYVNKDPFTNTLNAPNFMMPVLWSNNHLYIWASIGNWALSGNDAAVVDIDNMSHVAVDYTSIHSTGNACANPQGFSSFYVYGPGDYLFTLAPGSSAFDMTQPYNPAFPPGFVRITGGALNCASSATTGGADIGYFTLSADGWGDIFLGGFMDKTPGAQRYGLIGSTPATAPCLGSGACVTTPPNYEVASQAVNSYPITLNPVPPLLTFTSPTDIVNSVSIAQNCYTEYKPGRNTAATPVVNSTDGSVDIYPNPTNGATTLTITVSENTHVDLKLTNSIGQDVSNVIQQYKKDVHAGNYNVAISSDLLPAGVYYCSVSMNGQKITKKLVVY